MMSVRKSTKRRREEADKALVPETSPHSSPFEEGEDLLLSSLSSTPVIMGDSKPLTALAGAKLYQLYLVTSEALETPHWPKPVELIEGQQGSPKTPVVGNTAKDTQAVCSSDSAAISEELNDKKRAKIHPAVQSTLSTFFKNSVKIPHPLLPTASSVTAHLMENTTSASTQWKEPIPFFSNGNNTTCLESSSSISPSSFSSSKFALVDINNSNTGTINLQQSTEDVPYAYLCDVLADISKVNSRLEATKFLAMIFLNLMLRTTTDGLQGEKVENRNSSSVNSSITNLADAIYLCVNKLGPAHEGLEFGIGDATLIKVVSDVCGMTEKRVKEEYQRTGDLAEIAQDHKQGVSTLVKSKLLTITRVMKVFREIARTTGKDTQRRRGDMIKILLRDAKGPECNFLIRSLQCKLRIGMAELTVLTALGHAAALLYLMNKFFEAKCTKDGIDTHNEQVSSSDRNNILLLRNEKELFKKIAHMNSEELQIVLNQGAQGMTRLYSQVPSYEVVIANVLKYGFDVFIPSSLVAQKQGKKLSIRPGIPVKPMLAHPANGITMVLDRLEGKRSTCEYKYDGERIQIHYRVDNSLTPQIDLFSRNCECHTGKYPDILEVVPSIIKDPAATTSFIIDAEAVAFDEQSGKMQNFQTLQHRGRKNVELGDVKVKVCPFAFDILYLNGEPLLNKSLEERRAILYGHFTSIPGLFQFATHLDTQNTEEIQEFLNQAITAGAEGLMLKTLSENAMYIPAKRSHCWMKLKKDYMNGVTDTLDLVPIAAYFGKGKRAGVYGGFLLASYDNQNEEFQTICKMGTGLSEAELEAMTAKLSQTITPGNRKHKYYRTKIEPNIWFEPTMVWEVKAADLSISPIHTAAVGMVDPNKGIALRFPRFLKEREDKKPIDATNAHQIREMYMNQSLILDANKMDISDDD